MVSFQNAFISYGRADSQDFAIRLNQRLTEAGLTVWFDAKDIPFGIDYQDEIDAGIANSDSFLYIISPHSVNSPYCDQELNLALTYNKHIIPVMHVQELNRHTWQTRNPRGSDADWQAYQEKGLHSSHLNLHPAIGRINWIFCCEGIHDFEQSLQDLLDAIHHHQDYTRCHTEYLTQALLWEKQQHQPTYLLTPEKSVMGQDWLQTQFIDSVPPCLPTRLHCEFIAESLKASHQGMTHVFLSYSEDDQVYHGQIRQALMRQGWTVWSNTTDIRTGVKFQDAIYEGIEKTDTIVLLLSPHSLQSSYCQDELAYGLKYHKRIIPLMITPMEANTLPKWLRAIQFIAGFDHGVDRTTDQADPVSGTASTLDAVTEEAIAQLIRTLYDHADYYTQHKELLVKALAWDRCDRPNDLVLRGQDFVAAEAWWTISQQTPLQTSPTRLHTAFIQASQAQNRFFDAFISYGRADSLAFASRLHECLSRQGFNVWFDQQDIPVGVDFQAQIDDGIERSHNFIFIISPHSAHSPYCLKEIELAVRLNKRIIPLMHVEEIQYETWQKRNPNKPAAGWETYKATGKHSSFTGIHPDIGKINWIFCRETVDVFDDALQQLTTLLHQHERYVRQHTALLTRALTWQRHNYDTPHLLTGEQRRQAQQWLSTTFQEQPPCSPTALQGEFISASIKYANNFMTEVFLCYSEGDRSVTESLGLPVTEVVSPGQETGIQATSTLAVSAQQKSRQYQSLAHSIRTRLVLAGLTVWDYAIDIHSGESIQTATERGIETADTVLVLFTQATITSRRCQRELDYALSLHKRIIPLKLEPLSVAVPDCLAPLNVIDLSQVDEHAWLDTRSPVSDDTLRPLLQALQQDEAYYRTHKRLLAIALKWDRQRKNPTVLLRGNTLKQYDSWLHVARQRPHHPPVELQTAFVNASKKQPPCSTLDVFIIYAPEDVEFVRTLNETLQIQNQTTWFDETIQSASIQDLAHLHQDHVNDGINQSENIVFVVSPSSIKDTRCLRELNYAHHRHKRIVPLLYREVLSAQEHPVLAQTPWLDFQPRGDFSAQFGILFRQLESDPEHIRPHTRLLVRAREWAQAKRDKSYLLRGKELQWATDWLAQAHGKTPTPTPLQQKFIAASQALPLRKLPKRSIVFTSVISTGLIFGMRLFGWLLPLELWAYDQVLKLKPHEPQDDRFLIVQVDDASGRWLREKMKDGTYTPGIGTVPEAAMAQAIRNLEALNPSIIGLDFYRDFNADLEMAEVFIDNDTLIGLCKAEDTRQGYPGFKAAEELPMERVGFSDFDTDSDNYLRRHLIKNSVDSAFCEPEDSFNLVIARQYLNHHGQSYTTPWPDAYTSQPLRFGTLAIPQLSKENGSAYSIPNQQARLGGYQTLLNFRPHVGPTAPNPQTKIQNFAPHLSIQDVITNNIPAGWVQNRIVLIGYVDESDTNADFYNTPYGRVPGVVIQGQKISQLISTVLDERSLIWWWSLEIELWWMLSWSLLLGFIVWGIVQTRRLTIAVLSTLIALPIICSAMMILWSGWIPLIPPVLSASLTALITTVRNKHIRNP